MSSPLNTILLIAKRFLLSKSSDGFLALITWVSVVGVALGVLALSLVTSVINGFESELTKVITGTNGEVFLYTRGNPVTSPEIVEEKIRQVVPETESITRSFVTELMIAGSEGVSGAVFEGIDGDTIGKVTLIPERVVEGSLPVLHEEVALGKAIAEKIGAKVGEWVRLIAPFAGEDFDKGVGTGTPKVYRAKVVGIVNLGMFQYDSKFVYASLPAVQKFLKQPDRVTSFKLKLKEGSNSRVAARKLRDNFGYPFRAKDWSQLNRNLFHAIQIEKAAIAVILTAIVIVAAFNMVSTLMMMIHDKTREVSILKAIGFRPSESFFLFSLIGLGIGLVGTIAGLLLGLGMASLVEKFKWIDLPADIYHIGFLPVVFRWSELGMIVFFSIFICLLATLYPSIQVFRQSPLAGLRDER